MNILLATFFILFSYDIPVSYFASFLLRCLVLRVYGSSAGNFRGSPSLEKQIGISVFERLVCYEYHSTDSVDVLFYFLFPLGSFVVRLGFGRNLQGKGGQGWKLDCRFGTMNIFADIDTYCLVLSLSVSVILGVSVL